MITAENRPPRLGESCPELVRNCCRLLSLAGREPDARLVLRVVRTLPRDPGEADRAACPCHAFCVYCLLEAESRPMGECEQLEFERLATYFLDRVPAMDPLARRRLERLTRAVLRGFPGGR